ncbi:MAG: protein-glutamate O-methyltransferase CheR [Pseudobutyrivibrio sp.]|nr:protein-glutamate O-methyltransferase CheR [Pseudobutyrivibrio sp.]
MTDREFERLVEFLESRYGINLSQKKVIVQGRLDNYLARNGFANYGDYLNAVESDKSGHELQNMLNILTTNHTYFWREPDHFIFLKEVILPQIVEKERHTHDIRIWSGASSSGEEPYTIAMVIKEFLGLNYNNWDTTLLATDLSSEVLQYAIKGVYLKEKIEVLPEPWQKAYFKRVDDFNYRVADDIRKNVMFRKFNLMSDFPFTKKMHVVFLRNVMIYFSEDTKRNLVNKIYDILEPGGYLIIGNTENIDKEASKLEYVRPSIFRKPI